jgi:hypothetical protein
VGQLLNQSKDQNSSDVSRWKSLHFIIANQQDVTDRFAVSQDGTIYTQRGLDREERDIYRLTLITENSRGLIRGAGVYQVRIQKFSVELSDRMVRIVGLCKMTVLFLGIIPD